MGGVDNFSSEEALLIIGEMYVEKRRYETREEILMSNLTAQQIRVSELESELEGVLARHNGQPEQIGEIS